MLLALAVSAIVLAGIGGVFYSALRLRESTDALLDESTSLQQAVTLLRRDLQGALPPNVLAGDFRIGNVNSGIGQTVGLQFSTTTGVIKDDAPWGDVQDVTYELRNPTVRAVAGGRELIRSISRNLLTTMTLDYTEQPLLTNVESLEFQGYNGMDWQDLWDTSLTETNLPLAVRVRLQLVPPERADLRQRQPIEMIIPLTSQSRTNQVQATSSGQ